MPLVHSWRGTARHDESSNVCARLASCLVALPRLSSQELGSQKSVKTENEHGPFLNRQSECKGSIKFRQYLREASKNKPWSEGREMSRSRVVSEKWSNPF